MMIASHSHIDATAIAAYVGGWPSQEPEGRAEPVIRLPRMLGSARLMHARDQVPVRAPLPSHRPHALPLSAYAGDATRSAGDLLSRAQRAETSETCGEIGGLQTGLRSTRWDDCAGPTVGGRIGVLGMLGVPRSLSHCCHHRVFGGRYSRLL